MKGASRSLCRSLGFAAAVLSSVSFVAMAASCGSSDDSSVLPAARFDAFDIDAERRSSPCGESLSGTPRGVVRAGDVRPTALFANGAGVAWWTAEPASADRVAGSLFEWRLPGRPNGGGTQPTRWDDAFVAGAGIGSNEIFYSMAGTDIRKRIEVGSRSLGSTPGQTLARALLADAEQLFALVATEPCADAGCAEAPGVGVFRRELESSGSWTTVEESDRHRAPAAGVGDLALDERDLFYVVRAATSGGRDSIRAADKHGGAVRTLFEAVPSRTLDGGSSDGGDAGPAPPLCAPPDVCIDGQLTAHGGKVYWVGNGRLYAMPTTGGVPEKVLPNLTSYVVAYAIEGDFLYANEDDRGGHLDLVRHALTGATEDEVLVSQPFVADPDGTRRAPFALAPNAIYVAGAKLPYEIIARCRR